MKVQTYSVVAMSMTLWSGLLSAHDLASGPRMGFPPRSVLTLEELRELVPPDLVGHLGVRAAINKATEWAQHEQLVVCFRSGTTKARSRIATAALEWHQHVNIAFDFGDLAKPRQCGAQGTEDIKIDFITHGHDAGYWSYLGTESKKHAVSMNLDDFGSTQLPGDVAAKEFTRVVLHEFGHALGFAHEHQKPSVKCDEEFDPAKVAAWAAQMNWSAADVKANLYKLQPKDYVFSDRHDRRSLMHYSLPAELFPNGTANRCWVPVNYVLSDDDKKFAALRYPKLPPELQVAMVRARVTDADGAEAQHRAESISLYAGILREGGIPPEQLADYMARFTKYVSRVRAGLGRE